jgi:pyroglutamyl-peptidase
LIQGMTFQGVTSQGMTNQGMTLLITGFGPFPGAPRNPTGPLAKTIAARLGRRGFAARAKVLHVSYAEGLPALRRALERKKPRAEPCAVLMLGLASRGRPVRVERYARPAARMLAPDASGARPPRLGAIDGGPLAATASVQPALARLRACGLPARLSASAGRYLCNAAYALALHWAHGQRSRPPVLFIHIPRLKPLPGVTPKRRARGLGPAQVSRLAEALTLIGGDLARQARRAGKRLAYGL